MNNYQRGMFYISEKDIHKTPDKVAQIFASLKIVVIRCELLYFRREFEYYAMCPVFSICQEGQNIPEYRIIAEFDKNDQLIEYAKVEKV